MSGHKLKVHVTIDGVVDVNRLFEQDCICLPAINHTHEYPPKCNECLKPFKEIT